jgi:hypothetical protein
MFIDRYQNSNRGTLLYAHAKHHEYLEINQCKGYHIQSSADFLLVLCLDNKTHAAARPALGVTPSMRARISAFHST